MSFRILNEKSSAGCGSMKGVNVESISHIINQNLIAGRAKVKFPSHRGLSHVITEEQWPLTLVSSGVERT